MTTEPDIFSYPEPQDAYQDLMSEVDFKEYVIDEGIGSYECWGFKGYDRQLSLEVEDGLGFENITFRLDYEPSSEEFIEPTSISVDVDHGTVDVEVKATETTVQKVNDSLWQVSQEIRWEVKSCTFTG
jgi:hypothetical protein